jgi:hypothetical protein
MENKLQVIREQEIEACLIELRGQKVLLDRDVAILYGVETKRVNEAVRNNPDKFLRIKALNDESEIRYCGRKFRPQIYLPKYVRSLKLSLKKGFICLLPF